MVFITTEVTAWLSAMARHIRYSGATLLLAVSLTAAAHAGDWSGPYAGLGTGYQTSVLDGSARLGSDSLGLDLGASGALLSGYGGYGWSRGSLYLGGEANYGFSALEGQFRLDDREIDYRGRDTWGISGVMGGLLNPDTLLYGRAGDQQRRQDLSLPGFRSEDWTDGLRLGAGAEFRLWGSGSLRLEYSQVWHEEAQGAGNGDEIDYRAREQWFEAGGILRF